MADFSYWKERFLRQVWVCEHSTAAKTALMRSHTYRYSWCEGQARALDDLLYTLWIKVDGMNGRKNRGYVQNIKFVDLELTADQKSGFKEWNWTDEDSVRMVETMGIEGYKFGTRYDRTNGSWIVSITCAENGHSNYGYCLSARGKSFLHALAVVLYKHCIILRGEWTTELSPDENDGGWG